MKILITGATGFIGSRLVLYLIQNNYDVSIVVRNASDLSYVKGSLDKIKLVSLPELTTAGCLAESLNAIKPDVIVHLASLYISEHSVGQIEPLIHSNILFGAQLLEAMEVAGCKNLVNVSTSWQYYCGSEYDPVNLYAATKQAFLDIAIYYINAKKFNVVDLKLFDTYGADDHRNKLIPFLIKNLNNSEDIALSGGEQLINIVYVDDVLSCIEMAAIHLDKEGNGYEEYSVSSDEVVSLKELVRKIETISKKSLRIKWGQRPYRFREVMIPWNQGKRLSGWKPKINIKDGIERILGLS